MNLSQQQGLVTMEMKMTINPLTLLPDHKLSTAPLRQDQIRDFSLPACEKGVDIQIGKDISVTFKEMES